MVNIMRLIQYIKNNKKIRILFGKKELVIIMKQLEGRRLNQSERNRLSRDIKPKFNVISELNLFKDEFRLERNHENKRIIEKAVEVILNHKLKDDIKSIFLFGSFADGTFTRRSDIDICVVFRKDISLTEATKFRIRVSGELPDKADIQVFNILPMKVKRSIARNHKVLYKTKDYDNINFSIKYLKDDDYFIRMHKIFGAEV